MNELLFIVSLVSVFGCVVLAGRFFGKTGLTVAACFAAVMANLITPKQIGVFGVDVSMGAILFSSVYLCTDIASEVFGKKYSGKIVNVSLCCVIAFIAVTQLATMFKPNSFDFVDGSMRELFSTSIRVSVASVVMFYIANICDVYLFDRLKEKYPDALWFRNNVSTIVCNCMENFLFIIAAFVGIYSITECLQIALATCLVETIVGLCDTPFVYIGRKVCKRE